MIIRVQSPNGTKRVELNDSDSAADFVAKVQREFALQDLSSFSVFKSRNRNEQIMSLPRKSMKEYRLQHGDIVYLEYTCASTSTIETENNQNHVNQENVVANGLTHAAEDEVDIRLKKLSGQIERSRDEKMCRHGPNGKCVHCTPLEPYDEAYLKEHNIKHLSFQSYLRKLTGGIDKGKYAPLENISCKVKPGCKEHLPWPAGICTKCQPSAVTLNRQVYRHIDNVVFENPSIVERFLNYWRSTGHQRMGILYGYYDIHNDVPLGIKATVVAIYEPPQESTRDNIKLTLPDPHESLVDGIASQLGFRKIGWAFTDLVPEDIQKGTVKNLRNIENHFLSAQECITAAYFQNANPNPCRLAAEGYFGSKFATVCITGDKDNQVHMEGYQVSNQCMALVRDNCLVPTKDAPELGYVRETSREQYVPDVFFKEKNEFGTEVMKIGRPLPIEYVLVDVPASTPVEPKFAFNPLRQKDPFPIENRLLEGQLQDFGAILKYFAQFSRETQFFEAMSDFHLLVYLSTMDIVPIRNGIGPLLAAIRDKDRTKALMWAETCDEWKTLEELIKSQANQANAMNSSNVQAAAGGGPAQVSGEPWNCSFCTFQNPAVLASCEMCSLPKNP